MKQVYKRAVWDFSKPEYVNKYDKRNTSSFQNSFTPRSYICIICILFIVCATVEGLRDERVQFMKQSLAHMLPIYSCIVWHSEVHGHVGGGGYLFIYTVNGYAPD